MYALPVSTLQTHLRSDRSRDRKRDTIRERNGGKNRGRIGEKNRSGDMNSETITETTVSWISRMILTIWACPLINPNMSKYKSRKIITEDGIFDSAREYQRWQELKLMQSAGMINGLKRQAKFELIPAQKYAGKVIERACTYKADFIYNEGGQMVVEDSKGFKTRDYKIKRKLMLWVHGIRIKEV